MGHWCYYCVLFGCLSWRPIIRTEWTLKVSLLGLFLEPFRSCGKSNYEKTILKAFWKMCWSNILTWAVLWGIHSHSPHRQCAPSSRWTCIDYVDFERPSSDCGVGLSENGTSGASWQKELLAELNNLKNIARGTTDPEIDSVTWTKFSDHKAWSADGATCISSKFGHQMAKLALVINLATR